jgi:hypothetical protein
MGVLGILTWNTRFYGKGGTSFISLRESGYKLSKLTSKKQKIQKVQLASNILHTHTILTLNLLRILWINDNAFHPSL